MDSLGVRAPMTITVYQEPMRNLRRRGHWRPAEECRADRAQREAMQEVDAALEAWARWGRSLLQSMGWPGRTLLARIMEEGFQGAAQKGSRSVEVIDEAMEIVERAVLRLPDKERLVVIKHYTYSQPVEVSARYCHMHPTTFRSYLHRARRSIRDYLDGVRRSSVATKSRV